VALVAQVADLAPIFRLLFPVVLVRLDKDFQVVLVMLLDRVVAVVVALLVAAALDLRPVLLLIAEVVMATAGLIPDLG
jgi:hypothetical protein